MKNMRNMNPQTTSSDGRPPCVLTFDLEGWDEGDWMQPHLATAQASETDSDREIVERLLALLKDGGHTATFFTTRRFLDRYPDLIRHIHADGHEIGTHGPKHLRLTAYPEAELRMDLEAFTTALRTLIGTSPRGYRAPHFSLNKGTEWLLPLLRQQGYTYDSSQFSASGAGYGSTTTPNAPYPVMTPHGEILEIPVPGFPLLGTRLPFAGGLYFRALPLWMTEYALTHLPAEVPPSLYLHPHELQEKTPQITQGPSLKRALKYLGTRKAFAKFAQLTERLRFVSITQAFPALCKP